MSARMQHGGRINELTLNGKVMLRITTHQTPESLTFQLEGKLAGLWVEELDKCYRTSATAEPSRRVHFDLTGLTFVDEAGKRLLKRLCQEGAELRASGCLMKAIAAEIAPPPN